MPVTNPAAQVIRELKARASPSERQQYRELRKRVVRADNALRCCAGESSRVQIEVLRVMNEVLGFMMNHRKGADLALVPAALVAAPAEQIGIGYSIVEVSAGAPLAVGAIALGLAAGLDFIAESKSAYETWNVLNTAIGQALARRKSSCYECLKKSLLGQSKTRHRIREKILRRIG